MLFCHLAMNRYITLVASVKSDPSNTLSRFTTRLPETLELNKDRHEIGLAEILFPATAPNFSKGGSYTIFYKQLEKKDKAGKKTKYTPSVKYVKIPNGHYDSFKDLQEYLNVKDSGVKVSLVEETQRVKFSLESTVDKVWLTPDLAFVLGFEKGQSTITKETEAAHRIDNFYQQSVYYIYCDAVAPSIVGDTMSNLLHAIPVPTDYGTTVRLAFQPIRYLEPSQHHIDSIRIEILNEVGIPIPFSYGSVVVVLHVKDK